MAEWCMAHPWLTFWIVCAALFTMEGVIGNICRVCNNVIRMRIYEKTGKMGELEEMEG